jgi:hypothetical protein
MPKARSAIVWALAVLVTATGAVDTARSQVTFTSSDIQPPSVYTGRPDLFDRPGRGEEALPLGNWLVFSSMFAGGIFATNPSESPTGARASPGLRLITNSSAQTDDGIKKTVLYSSSEVDLYAVQNSTSGSSPNNLSSHTGAIETYQPFSDLVITAQGDFTRQENYFTPLGVTNNLASLNPTGVGVAPTANPVPYNQLSGAGSVQKDFSDGFVIVSGSIVDLTYDRSTSPASVAPSPNGTTLTGRGRVGYWFIPDLYGYVEASLDERDYATNALSSSGYRVVAGLGSDQIGLFRGELYGGYQVENYHSAAVGTTSGPILGGRGSYFPLPELTINASVDETIGASLQTTTPSSPAGTSTKVSTFLAQANYAIAPEWTATGRGGLALTTYGGTTRRDTAWTTGVTVTYSVWRSFGLTFDYQHTTLSSNVPQTGYTNDAVTLGASYKY